MRRLFKLLPHAVIVMAGMMIVFFAIDRVNIAMGFMANEFHKWLSLLLALAGLGYSVAFIAWQRKAERAQAARRIRAAQAQRNARTAQKAAPARRTAGGKF